MVGRGHLVPLLIFMSGIRYLYKFYRKSGVEVMIFLHGISSFFSQDWVYAVGRAPKVGKLMCETRPAGCGSVPQVSGATIDS